MFKTKYRIANKKRFYTILSAAVISTSLLIAGTCAVSSKSPEYLAKEIDKVEYPGYEEQISIPRQVNPEYEGIFDLQENTPSYLDEDIIDVNYVKAKTRVNIRVKPNTNSHILGVLDTNDSLVVLDKKGEWYLVYYNDTYAYVNANYVECKTKKVPNGSIVMLTYTKDECLGYKEPDYNSKSARIQKGEICEVYKERGDFYLVRTTDGIGYVPKSNLKPIHEKVLVVVDISSQRLILYKDNKIILDAPVVTGKNTSQTNMGLQEVIAKKRAKNGKRVELKGDDYVAYCDYAVQFNDDREYIHDADWRDTFGGTIYKKHGSHGCVNADLETEKTVYDNTEIGTPVYVKR